MLRRLAQIPKEIKEKVMVAQLSVANEIANAMRSAAAVDTGAMKDSIAVTPQGETTPPHSQPGGSVVVPEGAVMITAGDNAARHAHLVEWGSDHAEAQPFFFPAIRNGRKKAKTKIKRAMNKAIKDSAK